jgi:hypothetical protein
MPEEQLKLLFDSTLTKQNARARGLLHVTDLTLNEKTREIDEPMRGDVLRMVNDEGYKIGQPETPGFPLMPYGLYKPLKKPAQSQKKV